MRAWDKERVRALREKFKLTQVALSDLLGAKQQLVSAWETGLNKPGSAYSRLLNLIEQDLEKGKK